MINFKVLTCSVGMSEYEDIFIEDTTLYGGYNFSIIKRILPLRYYSLAFIPLFIICSLLLVVKKFVVNLYLCWYIHVIF